MKLEIGGGSKKGLELKGQDWINVDLLGGDVTLDLNTGKLPFRDDEFDEAYSAHCLEHVKEPHSVLAEIMRVVKPGSNIELRFPHWLHPMSMCPGHYHVISDRQIHIWCSQPQNFNFGNKKLTLISLQYIKDVAFDSFAAAFPSLHPDFILMNMPGCCHEIRAVLRVDNAVPVL